MKTIKRIGLGGVDMGVSNNPSFHRGMLKGLSRTIMAGKQCFAAVCRMEKYENDNSTKGETVKSKENRIR